jgi:hypothetical protein
MREAKKRENVSERNPASSSVEVHWLSKQENGRRRGESCYSQLFGLRNSTASFFYFVY